MALAPSLHARPVPVWGSFFLGIAVGAVMLGLALVPRIGLQPTPAASASPAGDQGMEGMPGMAGSMSSHEAMGHASAMDAGKRSGIPGYSLVAISPEREQLIGVRSGLVRRGPLDMSTRTVGFIEANQTRLAHIHLKVRGWITKVFANYVGQLVKKGDPLLEIYSPDLVLAQREYLIALGPGGARDASMADLAQAARQRLEVFDMPPGEMARLESSRRVNWSVPILAPIAGRILERAALEGNYVEQQTELFQLADLSTVWVQARIYEEDRPHVHLGQPVELTSRSAPGVVFRGTVSFIEPFYDEMTRTAKVRIEIPNPQGELEPGMFADVKIGHNMGSGLLIPDEAVLRTGERVIAFRVLSPGHFEPVEVQVGSRFGDDVEILSGLAEGERVVTSANYLIDSESRLKAVVGGSGHHHGN